MIRSTLERFSLVFSGTLFHFLVAIYWVNSLNASEISKPIWSEIRTHHLTLPSTAGEMHFEIHYPQRDESMVALVVEILKRDAPQVVDYFDYAPAAPIHISLTHTNLANGSATVFPHNHINLYSFPPIGNEHLMSVDTWVRGLVIHELVHVIHMDQTRGVLYALRRVFGSVGKLGGVVPRWFSEGLAVWAETHFTQGGRLRDQVVRYQIARLLGDSSYCQELSCLDDPGVFPRGQLAYWVGGAFMDYLEREKAGTLSCLVKANSDSLPFFLNSAFKECTGATAAVKFASFRAPFGAKASRAFLIPQKEWSPSFQARMLATSQGTVVAGQGRRSPELGLIDREGKATLLERPPGHIETLLPVSAASAKAGEALVTLLRHQSGFSAREIWRFNLATLKFERQVKFPHDVESAFLLEDGNYLTLRYDDHVWIIERGSVNEREEVMRFPYLSHVRMPRLMKAAGTEQLVYSLSSMGSEGRENFHIQALDLATLNIRTLLKSEAPLQVIGNCGGNLFVREKEGAIKIDLAGPKTTMQALTQDLLLIDSQGDMISYLERDDTLMATPKMASGCDTFATLVSGKTLSRNVQSEELAATLSTHSLVTTGYPSAAHFLPKYWMFDYVSSDNLDAARIYTQLVDPIGRHSLGMALDYYSEIEKAAPNFDYAYARGYLRLYGGFEKDYSQSSITRTADSTQMVNAGVGVEGSFGAYTLAATTYYAKKEVSDFISDRRIDEVSLALSFFRLGQFYDSFVGDTSLQARIVRSNPEGLIDYWGMQYRLGQSLHLLQRLKLHLLGTYGKLDKKDFRSGVIYAGGASNYNSYYFHEFYGISYSDAFGNEVATGRAQLDLVAYNAYAAPSSLFPFYLKELHLLGGMEVLHADRIFIDRGFVINQDLRSYHAGLRVLADLFYLLPIQSDLLYIQTESPFGGNLNDFIFLLRGNFSL